MSNISVKDVPDAWTEALRKRAVRNHRSLQGELMAIIERAVAEPAQPELATAELGAESRVGFGTGLGAGLGAAPSGGLKLGDYIAPAYPQMGRVAGFDRAGQAIVQRGWKSAAQIAAEMRAQFPPDALEASGQAPAAAMPGPSSVDMVREDRDSR